MEVSRSKNSWLLAFENILNFSKDLIRLILEFHDIDEVMNLIVIREMLTRGYIAHSLFLSLREQGVNFTHLVCETLIQKSLLFVKDLSPYLSLKNWEYIVSVDGKWLEYYHKEIPFHLFEIALETFPNILILMFKYRSLPDYFPKHITPKTTHLVQSALMVNPLLLANVPVEWQTFDMCWKVIQRNPMMLREVKLIIEKKKLEEIEMEAVRSNGFAIQYVANPSFVMYLSAVQSCGASIRYLYKGRLTLPFNEKQKLFVGYLDVYEKTNKSVK